MQPIAPLHCAEYRGARAGYSSRSGATHLAFFANNARLFATSSRHGQVRCLSLHTGASALHSVMMPCHMSPLNMNASLTIRQLCFAGLP